MRNLEDTISELLGLNSVFEKSRVHYRRFTGEPEQQTDGGWFVSATQKYSGHQVTAQGATYDEMAKSLRESVDDYYAWTEDEAFKAMRAGGDGK